MTNPNTPTTETAPARFILIPVTAAAFARLLWAIFIFCGTAWLVFNRGESAWLFVPAIFLLRFRIAL